MSDDRPLIFDLDRYALQQALQQAGQPAYRLRQIWQGLYQQRWHQAEQFTNLPGTLRRWLEQHYRFTALTPRQNLLSSDGETRKTLFELGDGQAVEAVLMRYMKRRTLCISTQAGCAMGCVFCATGQMGFRRNLTSGEIVEQVLHYMHLLGQDDEHVTNIVLMGMGEPFHNYEHTLAAIDRLNDQEGLNLGARRFTISTVGIVPAIRRFSAEQRQTNLAISLHAADDELRSRLLPVNRKYPLPELMAACQEYVQTTHRRLTFEWALIRDINDTPEQAQRLAERLQIFRMPHEGDGRHSGAALSALCHVNVIPLNPTGQYSGQAATQERAQAFQSILERRGIPCTIRMRRGIDIQAGCGQLAIQHQP